jgi:tetratricopeptide (TPR) repeat protein
VGRAEEATDKWKQATDYYSKVIPLDAYSARGAAENEILRKRFVEAIEILEKVSPVQRDKFWHQRKAQRSRGLGNFADALSEVDIAIVSLVGNSFAAAFYELRAQIRHDSNDVNFVEDLKRAIEVADSSLYKKRLEERLASLCSTLSGSA